MTDARGIIDIIMVLPGKAAASIRKQAADVLVRYLGGDPTLVQEIAANRFTQEELSEADPNNSFRFCGQTIESEAIKRKREELTLLELDGRAKKGGSRNSIQCSQNYAWKLVGFRLTNFRPRQNASKRHYYQRCFHPRRSGQRKSRI